MNEPDWLVYARQFIGLREVPGVLNNDIIVRWWIKLKTAFRHDSVPWCGLFCAVCVSEVGIPPASGFSWARSWLNWGVKLLAPEVGCVAIFERGKGGHVGFVVGEDQNDNLLVLGGNQNDSVSIAPFDRNRVLGYRWPAGIVVRHGQLTRIDSGARISTNEA